MRSALLALCTLWLFSTSADAASIHMVWRGTCTRPGKPDANGVVLTVDYVLPKGPSTGTLGAHDPDSGELVTNALSRVILGTDNVLTFDAPGIFRKQDVTRHYVAITNDKGVTMHGALSQDGTQEPAECHFNRDQLILVP
ncbi:hypothetical protein [Paraburkholderia sp. MM6662-R1]|uniref:hypothetical protein n=1 Tax=Paraburkholderia sp. MM6662-R1 TaxID=2991066 RepID=UPI003D20EA0C